MKKSLFSLLLITIASLCLASSARSDNQQADPNNLSGTWVLQKSEPGNKSIEKMTLAIFDIGAEIKITRRFLQDGAEKVQELVYYTDGRGELNPTLDGKRTVSSYTKRRKNTVIVKFALQTGTLIDNRVVNERVDEWKLASDAQTLTQTSSFTTSFSESDASHNPHSSPREPNIFSTPLRQKQKNVFKRTS